MSTIKTTNIQHPSAASPAVELTAAGGLWLGGGKILQLVRATDSTSRSTTSTSFVDASISVTITPQKSDSAILLIWTYLSDSTAGNRNIRTQITDSSNNALSGAEDGSLYNASGRTLSNQILIAYSTPATTSATTYKGRFRCNDGSSVTLLNIEMTGQMYAIEVSA